LPPIQNHTQKSVSTTPSSTPLSLPSTSTSTTSTSLSHSESSSESSSSSLLPPSPQLTHSPASVYKLSDDQPILKFVLPIVQLQNLPYYTSTKKSLFSSSTEEEKENDNKELVAERDFKVSLEHQYVLVLCVGENLIITIRTSKDVAPEITEHFDLLRQLMEDRMKHGTFCEFIDARVMTMEILVVLNEVNWSIRDRFKEWKVLIEGLLEEFGSDRYYLRHAYSMLHLSEMACNLCDPLVDALEEAINMPPDTFPNNAYNSNSLISSSLRTAYNSSQRLVHALRFSQSQAKALQQLYQAKGDERRNKILLFIAFFSALFAPLQLATGIYGMNFEYQPEYKWRNGYIWWWVMCISYLAITLYFLKRYRYLSDFT